MPHKYSEFPRIRNNDAVMTPDGPGRTVGSNMRKNTNGGPGVRQYVVQLRDGRIRHYSRGEVFLVGSAEAEITAAFISKSAQK